MKKGNLIFLLIIVSVIVFAGNYFGFIGESNFQLAPESVNCETLVRGISSDFRGYGGGYGEYIYNVDGWCCNLPKSETEDPKMCKNFKCFNAFSDRLEIVDLRRTSAELIPFWRAGECNREKQGSYAVEYKSLKNRFTFVTPGRSESEECKTEESICSNRYQEYQTVISKCEDGEWVALYNSKYLKEGSLQCSKEKTGSVQCQQNCAGTIRNILRDIFEARETQRVVKNTKNIIGLPDFQFSECEIGLKDTQLWNPPECTQEVPI